MSMIKNIPKSNRIIIMIDGCSKRNPGQGGVGVAFFHAIELEKEIDSESKISVGRERKRELGEKKSIMNFMFGLSFNLSRASNNYAEYCGLIFSLIFARNMLNQTVVNIYSDSELLIT